MSSIKLKNAPLKEAIFELFWTSPLDHTGFPIDNEFDLAQGKFSSIISSAFPTHKRIFPANSPVKMYGRPFHQFWKGEVKWPVTQLGPGILTVNDTNENYIWDPNYRNDIHAAINALNNSYSKKLSFNKVSLKYIDTVDIPSTENITNFIGKNLQTDLINKYELPGTFKGLNINQVFTHNESQVGINIQTAINNVNGNKAIIWITSVEKNGEFSADDIFGWLDQAHNTSSTLFVKMLNPEFYASFNQ